MLEVCQDGGTRQQTRVARERQPSTLACPSVGSQ
jgi:hypothetical protein